MSFFKVKNDLYDSLKYTNIQKYINIQIYKISKSLSYIIMNIWIYPYYDPIVKCYLIVISFKLVSCKVD